MSGYGGAASAAEKEELLVIGREILKCMAEVEALSNAPPGHMITAMLRLAASLALAVEVNLDVLKNVLTTHYNEIQKYGGVSNEVIASINGKGGSA